MSIGHSDVIHYKNPGIKTDSVEEFLRAAKAAKTVEVVQCAKPFTSQAEEWFLAEKKIMP